MPALSRANVPIALLCGLLLTACGSYSAVPVARTPDASLLLPCTDPLLAPDGATDNELAAERLRLAKAYLDCRARHDALVMFEKGGKP